MNTKNERMKYILLIVSFLSIMIAAEASELKFSELEWDFGTIEETGGKVKHIFELENGTSKPVVIHSVRTSCGCTTPNYSRKPINVGEKSSIEIEFDPEYRPGPFQKEILVYSTASDYPIGLTIIGTVNPRVLPLEERYPYTLGKNARLGSQYISFRVVPKGRLVQQSVEFKNVSDRELDIEFKVRDPKSLLQLYYDRKVAAQEGASVEIGYYLDEKSTMAGRIFDTVDIFIDGERAEKILHIKGLIVEK